MKNKFIHDNFMLQTKHAVELYHQFAAKMPIFDYHSHLPVKDIADDKIFKNLTQAWLYGDHYKWRAMRSNGIPEGFCTGEKSDEEKFTAWAQTVSYTLRNPLYHWTHLELSRYFGIDDRLLDEKSSRYIYNKANEMLNTKEFSVRNLIRKMQVKVVCTTDDPIDNLEYHQKIKNDHFEVLVLPSFRPDKGMAVESPELFNQWVDKLSAASGISINDYQSFIAAIKKRHDFFHEQGCRISDHGLETAYSEDFTDQEIKTIFLKARNNVKLSLMEILKFKSSMLIEFARMDHARGWVQQLHMGALRNNNTRAHNTIGADAGFDSIGDFEIARPLAKLLDRLDQTEQLPKTILYNLNPRDNELLATMLGNFQDGKTAGKMQLGSGWWFLDQKDGMEKQLNAISNLGLLSRFIGMLTDSRSFLSYPRHEYFRRILCNLLGNDLEKGELPNELELIGQMVQNICYNNAVNYFQINP